MNTMIALIRGINVGGNNIIPMATLAAVFEKAGFTDVRTYIQSGNVLFHTTETRQRVIERTIEHALLQTSSIETKVIVLSKQQLSSIVQHMPDRFADPAWKHNVLFLRHAIDTPAIVHSFAIKPDIESITYTPGALFWSVKLSGLTRSTMIKLSTKKEYQDMTVRNINTTKKLLALTEDMS